VGLKVSALGQQIGEKHFAAQILGGTYEHPYGHNLRTNRVVWQTFAKIDSRMSKNLWVEKDKN